MAEAHKADLYDGPDKPECLVRRDERRFVESLNAEIPYQVFHSRLQFHFYIVIGIYNFQLERWILWFGRLLF
jgi:hypothetical protein